MKQVLDKCQMVSQNDPRFTWVGEDFLLKKEVAPYTEMPLWVPSEMAGLGTVNCSKVIGTGLKIRPLADTIRDTLAWEATRSPGHEWRAGLTPEREAELLHAWHEVQDSGGD
jgi:2'-hydroxyisoflavone reductase